MSDTTDTGRYLRLTVDLVVEVMDVGALQAAALAEIRDPETELDQDERQEQIELVNTDDTGAAALQWLIEPDHVLGLVEHLNDIEPREAMLGVEPSDGVLEDEGDEDDHDHHDHDGHQH
ncbi:MULTISPECIES: hypothetical protein [Planotetraspora]|jgi:hypothetical protein|uniref:Uncharacterized protein n=2 Tax=Planotetraspora TaxID=58120 RepID=A0A8J3XL56_9ACTN|nr:MULTISPECIES: hypothetical protein [Planotetraspora]GII31033.1 hypothetical protein Pmi06nite_44750 [Planotetraspora mira]GII45967.1 hypothetical protein Psi02_23910 [Planotetraspora silvatica]